MYEGKIIHIVGITNGYLGEVENKDHPNGKTWIRLLNPCAMHNQDNQINVITMCGPEELYEPFVDINLPGDLHYEIRVVKEGRALHAAYKKEISRKKSSIIATPNDIGLRLVK